MPLQIPTQASHMNTAVSSFDASRSVLPQNEQRSRFDEILMSLETLMACSPSCLYGTLVKHSQTNVDQPQGIRRKEMRSALKGGPRRGVRILPWPGPHRQ